jgi:hypothetical protein
MDPEIHKYIAFSGETTFILVVTLNGHNCVSWIAEQHPRIIPEHDLRYAADIHMCS